MCHHAAHMPSKSRSRATWQLDRSCEVSSDPHIAPLTPIITGVWSPTARGRPFESQLGESIFVSCRKVIPETTATIGELDDEPTTALALRPKTIPRHQATAKSQMKTPNATRQRPSGSGRRHRESDESDGSSPGTAASEVFRPVSSKRSATTAPGSRPSTSRLGLHSQRNETLTGHLRARDTTDIDSNSDSGYVDQGGESDDSAWSLASLQATGYEAEESEPESAEDDESLPETIIAFELLKFKHKTTDHILNLMLSTIKKVSPGYVYCFSDMDVKGFVPQDWIRRHRRGAKVAAGSQSAPS
ncbi:hypothetical protein B0T11DRAFT_103730 [Plectosphaerella cucumerina]|uniref:Uncharacterized protein n=1 Tax=Plectosphaerella cucumerina TaxID=40658 RepID=A0A8K0TF68_9PEZI|nr:hypothetical protein B0T11DRAFT_103730 [Plectosphaerella cucumerina]